MLVMLALTCVLLATSPVPRAELDLSGPWQFVRCTDLDAPPPTDGWVELTVPGTISGHDYGAAWFRRSVDVPVAWAGRQVAIRFGGVRWNSRVLVNGQPVGGCFNGFDAFELDITAAVRPGGENEILVGCHDWTGVFDPTAPRVTWSDRAELRSQPADRVLAPIGGVINQFGIWDACRLIARPPVHLAEWDHAVRVAERQLNVRLTVRNATGRAATVPVAVRLSDADGAELAAAGGDVTVAAGQSTVVERNLTFPAAARLWSHEDPYLHRLELHAGQDVVTARIGLRELTVDGDRFRLNGIPMHLLGSSWWPPTPPASDEQVRSTLLALKAAHTHVFRTHTQPWPENWYRIADEVGVLMIPEAAIWNDDDVYRLDDPRFWDNYAAHLRAMRRSLGNHASVVMWSLENELTGGRLNVGTPERVERLASLAGIMRDDDPQRRPITYESDGDPGGAADVIGMHYPNEWPHVWRWPAAGDWLPGPAPNAGGGGGFLWPTQPFFWDHRKPLYIGEFLWIPSSGPDWSTVLLGDEAYADYRTGRDRAKALSWVWQIQAYRRAGLSGMCPWTMVEGGPLDETNPLWQAHRYAYQPVAAFAREARTWFLEGQPIRLTFDIYNDTLQPVRLTFRLAGAGVDEARELGELPPAARVEQTVELPAVAGAPRLVVSLTSGAKELFRDELPLRVEPRRPLPDVPLGLFADDGTSVPVRATRVAGLDGDLPPLLIVAPAPKPADAGPLILGEPTETERLEQYVADGGRLLMLTTPGRFTGLLGVTSESRSATMLFRGVEEHPLLAGVPEGRLQIEDSGPQALRPVTGGALPILVSGSAAGLSHCALLEVRRGRGVALFCSPGLLAAGTPEGQVLLANILAYLRDYQPPASRTGVLCEDPAARTTIERIGLDAVDLADPPRYDDLDVAVLVSPSDRVLRAPALRAFVERGGQLLLCQLAAEQAPALEALGITGLRLQSMPSVVHRLASGEGPVFAGLLREDLYWLGPREGVVGWAERPRLPGQATIVAVPAADPAAGTRYEVEAMAIEGAITRVEADHVLFATTGSARGTIDVPESGDYILGVTGWGTPCDGVFPAVQVAVDGQAVGEVYLSSREPGTYGVAARLERGRHQVALSFVNDRNSATEDRNAYLDRINIAKVDRRLGMTPLTSPAALLEARLGRGRVVLDQVRWMDPRGNDTKARRYLGSLLTALGAGFHGRGGQALEAETFRVRPGLQWIRPQGDYMWLGQGGWIETDLRVARGGRYRLTLVASGNPARGGWPVAALELGGAPLAEFTVDSTDWSEFSTEVNLPAGQAVLRLNYTNDVYDAAAGEDRNLLVDKLIWERLGDG